MPTVNIGTIKLFERGTKRGVITPHKSGSEDLYFEAGDVDAAQLRVGQLVQFVVDTEDGPRAKDVAVLSEKA